jgi:hypothetical protein
MKNYFNSTFWRLLLALDILLLILLCNVTVTPTYLHFQDYLMATLLVFGISCLIYGALSNFFSSKRKQSFLQYLLIAISSIFIFLAVIICYDFSHFNSPRESDHFEKYKIILYVEEFGIPDVDRCNFYYRYDSSIFLHFIGSGRNAHYRKIDSCHLDLQGTIFNLETRNIEK